uniref:Helitron helicase-like domain-containing protein n=1 Tax=Amphimedon queenslandica TaxID=400682 RepID=A0A1X7TP96_AMPQE
MCGAPHYHILVCLKNVPVVGIDHHEEVYSIIQNRITCHIPDSNTSPDLNFLRKKIPNAQVQQILERKYES